MKQTFTKIRAQIKAGVDALVMYVRFVFKGRYFVHDCDNCKPLGTYQGHDLYFCCQGASCTFPIVIARYGNKGWEYLSGLTFATDGPLSEAKRRAQTKGFLSI